MTWRKTLFPGLHPTSLVEHVCVEVQESVSVTGSLLDSEYQPSFETILTFEFPSSSQIVPDEIQVRREVAHVQSDLSPDPEGTARTASCLFSGTGNTQFDSVGAEFSEGFYFNFWNEKRMGMGHHSERMKA